MSTRRATATVAGTLALTCATAVTARAHAQVVIEEETQERERNALPVPRQPDNGLPPQPMPRRNEALAGAVMGEVGASMQDIDFGTHARDYAGAGGVRILVLGANGALTYRANASGALGGGGAGLFTRLSGDASVGPALELSERARLFARLGLELTSTTNDALDASLYTIPSGYAGLQLANEKFIFELGPRVGATLRSNYDPGTESEGLRHHRRGRVRASWGGTAALVSTIVVFQASLTRVEERRGLWFAESSFCGVLKASGGAVLCASGQYWRGAATSTSGELREIPALNLGVSIGFGLVETKVR